MQLIGKTKKPISILLVLALFAVLLIGCSSTKAVSANINDKLELAVKYISEKNYQEAILTYQAAIKIDSKNITAYKGLSLAYQLNDKMDLAEKALDDGLKAVTQTAQLKLAKAGLMLDQDKADKAELIYKELISGDNPTVSAYQAYTYYLNRQGKQAEAIALLEQAVAKNIKEYKLNSMLAELYHKNGDQEKALVAINKSLTIQMDQSQSYKLLAEMYQNKWAELIVLGDQFINKNQVQVGQLLKLSGLFGMSKYEDVIKLYRELTSDLKDNARARLIAAKSNMKLSKKEQSIELMKPIKVAELKDAGILADLAAVYLEVGDKDNARKIALLGMEEDVTVLENYVVMYKSSTGEEARIWAIKYIIMSGLSYNEASALVQKQMLTTNLNQDTEKNILLKESPLQIPKGVFSSLNPSSTKLRFYGGTVRKSRVIPDSEYKTRFAKHENINFQIFSYINSPGRKVNYEIKSILYKSDGSILDKGTAYCSVEANWRISSTSFNDYNVQNGGYWEVGSYKVEAYIEGKLVASGSFEVY